MFTTSLRGTSRLANSFNTTIARSRNPIFSIANALLHKNASAAPFRFSSSTILKAISSFKRAASSLQAISSPTTNTMRLYSILQANINKSNNSGNNKRKKKTYAERVMEGDFNLSFAESQQEFVPKSKLQAEVIKSKAPVAPPSPKTTRDKKKMKKEKTRAAANEGDDDDDVKSVVVNMAKEERSALFAATMRDLRRAIKNDRIAEAVRIFEGPIKENRLHMTFEDYLSLLKLLAKYGRMNMAFSVYQHLKKEQLKPNRRLFGILLTACAQGRDPGGDYIGRAKKILYEDMPRWKITPNTFIYNEFLRVCANRKDTESALTVYKLMKSHMRANETNKAAENDSNANDSEDSVEEARVNPDKYTYTTLIKILAKAGLTKEAFAVFDDMRARRLALQDQIEALVQKKGGDVNKKSNSNLRDLERELERMIPDVFTYNALITACKNGKEVDLAFEVYREMIEGTGPSVDVRPTPHTYSILLGAANSRKQYGKALDILKEMRAQRVSGDAPLLNNLVITIAHVDVREAVDLLLEMRGRLVDTFPDTLYILVKRLVGSLFAKPTSSISSSGSSSMEYLKQVLLAMKEDRLVPDQDTIVNMGIKDSRNLKFLVSLLVTIKEEFGVGLKRDNFNKIKEVLSHPPLLEKLEAIIDDKYVEEQAAKYAAGRRTGSDDADDDSAPVEFDLDDDFDDAGRDNKTNDEDTEDNDGVQIERTFPNKNQQKGRNRNLDRNRDRGKDRGRDRNVKKVKSELH
eukprot:GEZU01019130.1.p1 GENE.GEZU01019130.1~~GEZU01019130.1.p1  ORF type:complete len:786 (+),score=218.42 GEZU01019130.1:120-2360(+)